MERSTSSLNTNKIETADKTKKSVPQQLNFIQKTYELINNQKNWQIIHWNKLGTTFVIQDIQRFERELLSQYFRHNRYQSFVRQLNMYDFHKIRNGDYYCDNKSEFRHQQFSKDNYQILSEIKRKSFQCKNKDKKNNKVKKISKNNVKKNVKKKQNVIEKTNPTPKQPLPNSLSKQQHSFFDDISIEGQNNKQLGKQTKQKKIQKITKLIKQHYQHKQIKKANKISEVIELAEQVKDRWIEIMQKISGGEDIKVMKQIYYAAKDQLTATQLQDRTASTPSIQNRADLHLTSESKRSSEVEKQIQVDLFQMTDEEDALIQSIFRAQIRSTLICITSETVLNSQFMKNMDSIMGM